MASLSLRTTDFLSRTIYKRKEGKPYIRDRSMEVICVGFSRSGTESLQSALVELGYDHTWHGWDLIYRDNDKTEEWVRLCRKKYYGAGSPLCADDFDKVLGHCTAVCDFAGALFAPELIAAYPEAKVILNTRKNVDAWRASIEKTLLERFYDKWTVYILSWFDSYLFWVWHAHERYFWPLVFRAPNGCWGAHFRNNGQRIFHEHVAMIRGLVDTDNLLEWTVEDGYEPMCKFLNKPIPTTEFPRKNNLAGFAGHVNEIMEKSTKNAIENMFAVFAFVGLSLALVWKYAF